MNNEKIKNDNLKIMYNKRARRDGYDFSTLTEEEQKCAQYIYTSEEAISNFYLAHMIFQSLLEGNEIKPKRKWGFPQSGYYYGYVLDCQLSDNSFHSEYILKVLVNDCEVRYIKFTKSFSDAVFIETKRFFQLTDSIFHPIDMEIIKNYPVRLQIENIILNSGKTYSKVVDFWIMSEVETDVIHKMINLMFKQSQ